jgi:outer membrane protein OmpA-like peptidoglycan-associated protein
MMDTKLDGRGVARRAAPWLTVLSALALAACSATPDWANPVEWYKGATSIFSDEPQPPPANEAAAEMAKKPIPGEGEPFPNLASVPERPKSVTPSDERKKITEALVSDRANARYVEAPAPRARPIPAPASSRPERGPDVTPSPRPPVSSAPASPPPSSSPASSPEASTGVPPTEPPPSPVPPPTPRAEAPRSAPAPVASAQPAPPPPARVAPPPAPEAAPAPTGRTGGKSLVVEPSGDVKTAPAGEGSARPDAADGGQQAYAPAGRIPGTVPMAVVLFNEGGTQISAEQRQGLGAVVHEAKARGATVRVVGHSSPSRNPESSTSLVNNFHVAMDRAQSVATALIRLGLPAAQVKVEADTSPDSAANVANVPPGDAGLRRADVFLE